MKKIYAILVAAVMSVSLFAAPTQADLASYLEEGYYVVCFQAPADATCKDIYWMGQYADWNIATALEDLVKCEPLTGANAGWYVAKVPADKGTNGKPIQLNECGKLTWDVQPGSHDKITLVAGSVNIIDKGAETDLEGFSTTEATIITIAGWKNDYNPCEKVCAEQSYTIRVYPPYCQYLEDAEPTIRGSFDQWAGVITMEFKGSYFEYVSEPVGSNFEFKFNNSSNKDDWSNQFQVYNEEKQDWENIPAEGNLSLSNGKEFYTYDEAARLLVFNFSDETKYRYAGCVPSVDYSVKAKLPAENCPAVVEIIGDFGEGWQVGTPMTFNASTGHFEAAIEARPSNEFKFRSGVGETSDDKWKVEIQIPNSEVEGEWKSMNNFKFEDVADEAGLVELDLSDPAEYRWTPAAQGIEEVVLTEKAHKVVVDGVLYIVRDNKMFNIQGAQVR